MTILGCVFIAIFVIKLVNFIMENEIRKQNN